MSIKRAKQGNKLKGSQLNDQQQFSSFNLEQSKDNKGISYSTLKHNTTVETDSVNNQDQHLIIHSMIDDKTKQSKSQSFNGKVDNSKGILESNIDQTVHFQNEEFFQAYHTSSEDQTFIQNVASAQKKNKIFQQNDKNLHGRLFSQSDFRPQPNLIMPSTFLDSQLFYPQAFENQLLLEQTLEYNQQYFNFIDRQTGNITSRPVEDGAPFGGLGDRLDQTFEHPNFLSQEHLNEDEISYQQQKNQEIFNGTQTSWNEDTMLQFLTKENQEKDLSLFEESKYEDQQLLNELEFFPPLKQQQTDQQYVRTTNLKHLVNFIHGDIYHCAICSSKFEEPNNLPRVLYCGDCLCERCLRQSIMPKALNEKNKKLGAATQLTCLVCNAIHVFKLAKNGFVICNDKYVKIRDEHGLVNYIGDQVKFRENDIMKAVQEHHLMDHSVNIPEDLIIRSIPINVELIELIREQMSKENQKSIIQQISKFIQLDQLDVKEARYYLQELCKICEEDIGGSTHKRGDSQNSDEKRSPKSKNDLKQQKQNMNAYYISNEIGQSLEDQYPKINLNLQSTSLLGDLKNDVKQGQSNLEKILSQAKNITSFRKSNEEISIRIKKTIEKKKNQIFQTAPQSKPAFKNHHNIQVSQVQTLHNHQHSHHLLPEGQLTQQLGISASQAFSILPKKHKKISHHFGPGNHIQFMASRKDNIRNYDYEDDDDEEGLDEREPEKAICSEKGALSYQIGSSQSPQTLLDFNQVLKQQIEKFNEEQRAQLTAGEGNGSSQKKNKRKRKKRQKAKQNKIEQKILMQKGLILDEGQETDLYSMMVPGEIDYSKGCRHMQTLAEKNANLRNPFKEYLPFENYYSIEKEQKEEEETKTEEKKLFSLTCDICTDGYLLIPNQSMNINTSTQNIQKFQQQMTKEIMEAGVLTVITHSCNDCGKQMCLLCSIEHKSVHPNHTLKQTISKALLQSLVKKNSFFEQLLNISVADRIRNSIDTEISKLNATFKQTLKLGTSSSQSAASSVSKPSQHLNKLQQLK